ncbi:MAG: hypothetical protein EXS00_06860 [Phycisphaerales bacterium]|nr:hypothetical protein [Phycisphaerales bacterium]
MSDLTLGATVKFSIKSVPAAIKHRKTIHRLMRMQPSIQRILGRLAKIRDRKNDRHQRGGRIWTSRIKATQVLVVEKGATFAVRVTPQLIPDIKSVSRFLETV